MTKNKLYYNVIFTALLLLCDVKLTRAYGCTTDTDNPYGNCVKLSESCILIHQSSDMPTCPPSAQLNYGEPNYPDTFDTNCEFASNSNSGVLGPTTLNLNITPYNKDYFLLNVSWNEVYGAEGYTIEILQKTSNNVNPSTPRGGRHCVRNKTMTSKTFRMSYSYDEHLSTCTYLQYFTVKIQAYPQIRSDYYIKTSDSYWPTNCYNFTGVSDLHQRCGPPLPNVPHNISIKILPLQYSTMSLHISWEQPIGTLPDYPINVYYIEFYKYNLTDVQLFRITNATAVLLEPLHSDTIYFLSLFAYQPYTCTDPFCTLVYPCGSPAMFKIIPPVIPSVIPSSSSSYIMPVSTSSVHLIATSNISPTPSSSAQTIQSPPPSNTAIRAITIPASVGGGVAAIVISVFVVILIVAIIVICKKGNPPIRHSSPPPTPTTIESLTPPISPLPDIPYYHAAIVHSRASSDQDIQAIIFYLFNKLGARSVSVGYLDKYSRTTPAEWLDEVTTVHTKILCVCNEEFYHDWCSNTPGSLVSAIKFVLYASINQGKPPSDRFIVVLLEERHRNFIPADYLRNVPCFLINETVELASCIKGIPEYDTISTTSSAK